MESTVEELDGHRVRLAVEIDESLFGDALDEAWRDLASEARIPGFRKGKVPPRVLKSRMDPQIARGEALRTAVAASYQMALSRHGVDAIDEPQIDITSGETEGTVAFDATVTVRPRVEVPGYASISVTVPRMFAGDDEVEAQVDRLRAAYGQLEDVERPVGDGDYVTLDLEGSRDGEALEGLTATDYLYQVGSAAIIAELDEHLLGAGSGDEIDFTGAHPAGQEDEPVDYHVRVSKVQERRLPDLTDEWIADVSEFESVNELRDDIVERLQESRLAQARMAARSRIGEALAALVAEEAPAPLVGEAMKEQITNLSQRLGGQGMTLDQYLEATGTSPEEFTQRLRSDAELSVKVDLALRAVADHRDLDPSSEELDAEIAHLALHAEVSPEDARENLERNGFLPAVRADVAKRKAMDWLIENVEILDEDGHAVERAALLIPEHEHDEHEHDEHEHDEHEHDGHDDDGHDEHDEESS